MVSLFALYCGVIFENGISTQWCIYGECVRVFGGIWISQNPIVLKF